MLEATTPTGVQVCLAGWCETPMRREITGAEKIRNRALGAFAAALLVAVFFYGAGCCLPPSVMSLDQVLRRQGADAAGDYGYRCTAGAHRGASHLYRENTLQALTEAERNSRYAFIEFDVQYSLDGRIVVYHDQRMLRQFGSLKAVGDATYAQLEEITGGEIAAYDEIMPLLQKKLNIEIKSQGETLEDFRLVDEIIADITRRGRLDDVLISSISSEVVSYVTNRYPHIAAGRIFWLTTSTYLPFDRLTRSLYQDMEESRADYLLLHVANLRNIDDLLEYKPRETTLMFWDFDDNAYLVHKDLSDRLWGESMFTGFYKYLRFRLHQLLH